MSLDNPRAVLFDFDGTLVDSERGIVAGWHHTLRTVGLPDLDDGAIRDLIGPPLVDVAATLAPDAETAQAIVTTYLARYDTVGLYEYTPYAGVEPALAALIARGHRLAVATSKTESIALTMLRHMGWDGYFEVVSGAMRDGSRRHKHEVIRHALDLLGTRDAVMVGDRDHDVNGAHRHALPCIGVLWGYGSATELSGADALATTPADLPALISRVG
jgi:phosphoglycolate phosphatase